MPFVRTMDTEAQYPTPRHLYRDLNSRAGAVPDLWTNQGEVLKTFSRDHKETSDLALESPTGTGKTLTGLLIAEWTRKSRRARVVYACPTKQLAQQVAAAAHREGIDVVLLVDSHWDWPQADQRKYESAGAVAVTTYSTIFNSKPALAQPDQILFDDAHAGEQYVSEQYGVSIKRFKDKKNADAFDLVLKAVSGGLDGVFLERLQAEFADPGVRDIVRMVVPLRQPDMVARLDKALGELEKPFSYRYSMIRSGLAACLVYVAYNEILIRPLIPPTERNSPFHHARQRIYLSATLGQGGELERAFGREKIVRLQLPDGSPAPRAGRRFFVFPDLMAGADPKKVAKKIVKRAGKALVLSPDTERAMTTAKELARTGWPVLGVKDVEKGMEPFALLEHATCGLAARYDGLDLPDDACRVVVLDGLPDQDTLQEKFLTERARAGSALAERVRTRVVQGAGRCTRNPKDTAIVVVLDPGLSRYFSRPETIDALDPELQAEVRFGRENSEEFEESAVLQNVDLFLGQGTDDGWRIEAEPILTDYRNAAVRTPPPGTAALASSVHLEIQAWSAAGVSRWEEAATKAQEAARHISGGGASVKGYRALWLYLAAIWKDQAAADAADGPGRALATALIRQAEDIVGLGTWIREMAPLPAAPAPKLRAHDAIAVGAIAARLEKGVRSGSHVRQMGEMRAGLQARRAEEYEPALTTLGTLLGATSSKSQANGRCDSTWCWDNDLWLAMEAKSDHEPHGVVPHKDIRQANDQLRLLAADRGVALPPVGSATVIISPKPAVDVDGAKGAEAHVFVTTPQRILDLAEDVEAAWKDMIGNAAGRKSSEVRELVAGALSSRGILPSQVLERLTDEPVGTREE